MNPKVDHYLSKATKWKAELTKLRAMLVGSGMTEEFKWGKPCYMVGHSNVVILLGFKEYCALLFCKGALLKNAKGTLVKAGENTQAARQLRFTKLQEITKMERTVQAYIDEAIAAEKEGLKVKFKEITEHAIPEELQRKLNKDAAFRKAFHALTPGRQRGYYIYISGAKQSTTRESRVEKCVPQILAGKGWNEFDAKGASKGGKKAGPDAGKAEPGKVVLLSGGNPQIAKGDGDEPVQAYIAAMPGWKSDLGRQLDALITRAVPKVRKAVRWNSPFYGSEKGGWFVSFHVLTKYVKVTFFDGASLKPMPPGFTDRSGEARWIDLHEKDGLDETQMTKWMKQAAALPGWRP